MTAMAMAMRLWLALMLSSAHLAHCQEGGGGAEVCAEVVGTMSQQLNSACCQTADCSTGPLSRCASSQPLRDLSRASGFAPFLLCLS